MAKMKHEFDSLKGEKLANKFLYFGEVVSIDDPFESRTIKVRIPDFDTRVENADLPECYPLFPAFFNFTPKVGERAVIIMDRVYNSDKIVNQEKRYYLAVTISQPQNINNDPYYYTASSNESDGWTQRKTPISEIPEAKGTYFKKDEIGIVGRDNTDMVFKDKEVLIRAGRHEADDITAFNRKDPAYIQIRYAVENASRERKTKTITKIEKIEPTHAINVFSDSNNRLQIKVFRMSDDFVAEIFSGSYDSRERLIEVARSQIRDYQTQFPKWQLRTIEEELQDLPKLFKNNQRVVKQQVEIKDQNEFDQFAGSAMNFVAEKINLLSHLSAKNYNLTNPEGMIDGQTQVEINSTAHPMVYGDNLVEFLNLIKIYVANHVHPYNGLPADKDEILKKIMNYNFDNLLDKNIRLG